MLVSVILPTYDRAHQLAGAVDSVLAQTHGELELIVVDDGSTDDTRDVVAQRCGSDPRVVYVRQENAGVARARNTGLERARGEAIAFLDSDDAWRPWKLALQLACLQRAPRAGMIWTDMDAVDASGNLVPGSSLRDILPFTYPLDELFEERVPLAELPGTPAALRKRSFYVGDVFSKMVIGNLVLPSSAVLTRGRLDRVEPFDESLSVAGEDFDFFLRVCREGDVAFADVSSVLYQIGREDQLTHPSKTLHLARNYVRTMDAALARDPDRIELAPEAVRAARAHGHSWTGRAYLETGDSRAARPHLRKALQLRPADAKTLALAGLALLPGPLCAWLIRLARRLRQVPRRRHPAPAATRLDDRPKQQLDRSQPNP
jgi:glycosyltransferase involved in cell wall biosynthesis